MSDWGRTGAPAARRRSPLPAFIAGFIAGLALLIGLLLFGPRYGIPVGAWLSASSGLATTGNDDAGLRARVISLEQQLKLARDALDASTGGDGADASQLQAKLQLAEEVTRELQGQLDKAFNEDIPALKSDIEARDAMLKKLDGEVARLSSVEAEFERLKANPPQASRVQEAEIRSLKSDLKKRDAALKQLDDEIARLTPFERQVETLQEKLAEAGGGADDASRQLRGELDEARKALAAAEGELSARQAEIEKLREQVASLKTPDAAGTGTAARPAATTVDEPPAEPAADRNPTPRDPLRVAGAMRDARGLDQLSDAERDRIGTGLIEGECVSKVLTDIFGKAPALATRDLISALDSDC